ncbi:hypothetical protein E4631_09060 [Hymenobacter sp. UV11]|uniref:DUF5694 domain-containing protein n=1 Tax=Hymenobacter sp. UV11 TaxID=1849735 RepID=UPI00105CBAA0|nr:DUF5694 domain-containing protein [Hymenobacter sp. UV11]TDN39787.1 hypothetical protein A8B98_17620 [Hymenobacter sp. UV11]TFZ67090.1 hypothetical protein E4631_09060 [Hymenobacter sp. UV11]
MLSFAQRSAAQTPALPTAKIKVYIVGTFHFDASAADLIHGKAVDMRTPQKQRELDELVSKLQKTQADKVFVEYQLQDQPRVDSTYALYRQKRYKAGNNEIYQLGYRLADKLNLGRVYCADARLGLDFDGAQAYAKQHGQEPILNGFMQVQPGDSMGHLLAARNRLRHVALPAGGVFPGATLLEQFKVANSAAYDRANMDGYLLTIARIGGGSNYMGADVAGDYFKRNVRIYTNLLRQVDVQRDKAIVLIIGVGHASLLKSILRYNSLFEVAEVLPLLETK